MRIFSAGVATETNTFCQVPTGLEDFQIQRGVDVLRGEIHHPALNLMEVWGCQALARGDEFIFSLNAWAEPSGLTVRQAYEALRDEILSDLRAAMPVDVVLLMLHGAMVAVGYEDCEQDIIERIRDIVGTAVVIGAEFDLHCHLHKKKIACADIVITYKEYPHVDIHERAHELFDLAISTALGNIRPTMGLFDCHMIGFYPTTRQPMRGFVDEIQAAEQRPGILSISFAHSFPLADVPQVQARMLVITDNDPTLAEQVAREFGLRAYAKRRCLGFESFTVPMEEALSRAMQSKHTPVVVADQSDNTGAGAPGDATFALRWLLERGARDVGMAIFYDPEVVRIAKKVGPGATLAVRLGGKLECSSGHPIDMEVTVLSIRDHYMHARPQQSGDALLCDIGDVTALRCGTLDVIVASRRCQCYCPSIFKDLGIDPTRKQLLVVKSTQHFYNGFAKLASEVIYMTAPGAAPTDPRQIPYQRLNTACLYPWIEDPLAGCPVSQH